MEHEVETENERIGWNMKQKQKMREWNMEPWNHEYRRMMFRD